MKCSLFNASNIYLIPAIGYNTIRFMLILRCLFCLTLGIAILDKGCIELMTMDFFEDISKEFDFKNLDIYQYSPLVLAYIGDTVYEIYVRTLVVSRGNAPVHTLHKCSVKYVKAKSQSDIIHRIKDFLSQEEQDIVRRGRNAKSGTIPKNADVTEYKYATGFESLLGYLYLKGNHERLMQILKMAVTSVNEQD